MDVKINLALERLMHHRIAALLAEGDALREAGDEAFDVTLGARARREA